MGGLVREGGEEQGGGRDWGGVRERGRGREAGVGEDLGGGEAGGDGVFGTGDVGEMFDGIAGVVLGGELELDGEELLAELAVGAELLLGEEFFGLFFGEAEVVEDVVELRGGFVEFVEDFVEALGVVGGAGLGGGWRRGFEVLAERGVVGEGAGEGGGGLGGRNEQWRRRTADGADGFADMVFPSLWM